jgi:PadR family transcriptional regulator, regulatory protein PadR
MESLKGATMAGLTVIRGTLDVLVLKAVAGAALHGFEITCWLQDRSGGVLDVEESAVYQALYRLEGRGLVEAEWGTTANNRRARYYGITRAGRGHLREEADRMIRYSETVTSILRLREGEA